VMRITADMPGSISVEARFNSPSKFVDKITATSGKLVLNERGGGSLANELADCSGRRRGPPL